ncbi:MAG TPA: hypothetical protein VE081_10065 [Sporichthyaceae bacterium]|nr:hypothetical protein [Sporichthyaceae bacterium]
MAVVLIVLCALTIVALTYQGAGAWLRDRERRRRADGGPNRDGS